MSLGKDSVSLYKFKMFLNKIKEKEGRGTQLVSLYIPPERQISDVINYLRQEYATAANIKSKTTRKNVQDAIEKTIQKLKLFDKVPENGLIIFSGAIPQNGPGTEKIEVYTITPPEKITTFIYRCDSKFNIEPLKEMLKEKDVFGIIVIDNEEAAIAIAKGRKILVMKSFTSGVPGKHRAGGQSARRFERLREASLNEYYKRIGAHANEILLSEPDLKGVLIAGPGPTKEDFLKGNYLHYSLKDKIKLTDTSYSGVSGVREALSKAEDFLKELRYIKEKKLIENFLKEVSSEKGSVTYGEEEVINALKNGLVDTLLVSEGLEKIVLKIECTNCGYSKEEKIEPKDFVLRSQEILAEKCPKCLNQTLKISSTQKYLDFLIETAENLHVNIELISSETEEGEILKNAFGGIGAFLKTSFY